MGARHKLNAATVQVILLIAGVIAFFAQSWTVFAIVAAVLIASAIHSGDIRLDRRGRRRR